MDLSGIFEKQPHRAVYGERSPGIGGILRTIFVAICVALGFGPDKWAAFLIAGMPFLVTPGVVRLGFLLLASLTLLSLLWNRIVTANRMSIKLVSAIIVCLPFVTGAFYVTANSMPIKMDRHLKDSQKEALSKEMKKIPPDQLQNMVVASVDDPEAMEYATEFIYFFKYYQIPFDEAYAHPPDGRILIPYPARELGRLTGISISVHEADNPPESAKAFRQAMRSAGFSIDYETLYGNMSGEFMLTIRYN